MKSKMFTLLFISFVFLSHGCSYNIKRIIVPVPQDSQQQSQPPETLSVPAEYEYSGEYFKSWALEYYKNSECRIQLYDVIINTITRTIYSELSEFCRINNFEEGNKYFADERGNCTGNWSWLMAPKENANILIKLSLIVTNENAIQLKLLDMSPLPNKYFGRLKRDLIKFVEQLANDNLVR